MAPNHNARLERTSSQNLSKIGNAKFTIALLLGILATAHLSVLAQGADCAQKVTLRVEQINLSELPRLVLRVRVWNEKGVFQAGCRAETFALGLDKDKFIKGTTLALQPDGKVDIHFVANLNPNDRERAVSLLRTLVEELNIGTSKGRNRGALWNATDIHKNVFPFMTHDGGGLVNQLQDTLLQADSTELDLLVQRIIDANKDSLSWREQPRQAIVVLTSTNTDWAALFSKANANFVPFYPIVLDESKLSEKECRELQKEGKFCWGLADVGKIARELENLSQRYEITYRVTLVQDYNTHTATLQLLGKDSSLGTPQVLGSDDIEFNFPTPVSKIVWLPEDILFALLPWVLLWGTLFVVIALFWRWLGNKGYQEPLVFASILFLIGVFLTHALLPLPRIEPESLATLTPTPTIPPTSTSIPVLTKTLTLTATQMPTSTATKMPIPTPPGGTVIQVLTPDGCSDNEVTLTEIKRLPEGRLQIVGTATTSNPTSSDPKVAFAFYTLWVKLTTQADYKQIFSFDQPVTRHVLAQWDPKEQGLASGQSVDVRLQVHRKDGNYSNPGCIIRFTLP